VAPRGRHRAETPPRRPPLKLLLGSAATLAVSATMLSWHAGAAPSPVALDAPTAPAPVQQSVLPPGPDPAVDAEEAGSVAPVTGGERPEPGRSRSGRARAEITWATATFDPAVELCGHASSADGFSNGEIPLEALCELPQGGHYLQPDAAVAWERLAEAYAEHFGTDVCITDSYRSYVEQVALLKAKKDLAAAPGTSNHGWGLALDLCGGIESFDTPEHLWMREHAPAFGWDNPEWAHDGTGREEPWHWEHVSATD
jgi:hypothetical protein